MINYETLLSSYDDKLTLMQWLKKVEAALKDASAVSFNVNKRGDATLTFSVVFEDGSELETDPIILQQGESVESAAIVNGHLILTLTNGDELDAGNLGAVSGFSINGSQHLIVTYQDGTTQDLGAIFNGNVNIVGTLTTSGAVNASSINANALTSNNDEIVAQKPVVEDMSGFTFYKSAETPNVTREYVYAGCVKNGNKLTFVIALNITRTGAVASGVTIGGFNFPASIGSKIYPVQIGAYYAVDVRKVHACSALWLAKDILGRVVKVNDENIAFGLDEDNTIGVNSLDLNTKYYVRYELTLLLSDTLVE